MTPKSFQFNPATDLNDGDQLVYDSLVCNLHTGLGSGLKPDPINTTGQRIKPSVVEQPNGIIKDEPKKYQSFGDVRDDLGAFLKLWRVKSFGLLGIAEDLFVQHVLFKVAGQLEHAGLVTVPSESEPHEV